MCRLGVTANCGAYMTITGSLANTTDVVEKAVIVDIAESGAPMKGDTCLHENMHHQEQDGAGVLL